MSPTPLRRRRRLLALSGALAASSLVVGAAVGLGSSTASSHREAPLISGTPKLDNTDVYAFVSPDKPDTATIVANFNPFEDPAGGPNFYSFDPTAKYYVNFDLDGDVERRPRLQLALQDQGPQPRHLPLQHRPGHPAR